MNYDNIQDVSIYVGPACNFNCTYCDRAYVNNVGVDSAECDPALVDFVVDVVLHSERPMVSFHGGEPFVYIKTMEKIIEAVLERVPDFKERGAIFFIQTNGSLITRQRAFFEKYKEVLYVSISYDFKYQGDNRTAYDIDSTLQLLNDLGIGTNLQYVIPTYDKNACDHAAYSEVMRLFSKFKLGQLNLILLRHIRQEDKFETVIADESIDLKGFFLGFMRFVQLLYVSGINVHIDGHANKIDKNYYNNHKQMVLAPNGLIVPEYQFIEYDDYDFAIGRWKPYVEISRDQMPEKAAKKIRKECQTCPMADICGLRYHYAMFDMDPPTPQRCKEFYSLNLIAIKHLYKLKEQPTLLHHLGVQQ
ncbi:hypothetical protein [Ralstonia phage RP31]|uniref:Radical SAM core domain-containing protein n=2 Tax=Ripduovirus RP12 TaxID=2560700 RepID=A0A1L7N0Q4_9CAUD|nr:radical SAM domain-containing protein [Ralstonia phage RP12]BAW19051.1 hypothetical protein [Ralstonia phage RP12]BAW19336.1 hypothetical protein [Ralstonia phage RP31]